MKPVLRGYNLSHAQHLPVSVLAHKYSHLYKCCSDYTWGEKAEKWSQNAMESEGEEIKHFLKKETYWNGTWTHSTKTPRSKQATTTKKPQSPEHTFRMFTGRSHRETRPPPLLDTAKRIKHSRYLCKCSRSSWHRFRALYLGVTPNWTQGGHGGKERVLLLQWTNTAHD